jgi:deoxyribodipyrimidine photo-lyase
VAGTGTDSRPNRVLNPVVQGRRFDPEGAYVRRWVPELARVPGAGVHEPWKLRGRDREAARGYAERVVDLAEGLERFRRARA